MPDISLLAIGFLIPILLPLGIIVKDLYNGYRNTKSPLQAIRIQYLLLAMIIVWIGMSANGSPELRPYPVDVIANITGAFIITYAILRYQLLDIYIVIRKVVLYIGSALFIGGSYFKSIFLVSKIYPVYRYPKSWFVYFFVTIIMALMILPLRDRLHIWIGQVISKEKSGGIEMIQRLSHTIILILEPNELASLIIEDLIKTMHIQWAALFLEQEKEFRLVLQRGSGANTLESINRDHPVCNWLAIQNHIITIDTMNEMLTRGSLSYIQLDELRSIGLELFVPLLARDNLIGILGLGSKLSRHSYTQDDEFILNTLASQVAIAMDNARLYDTVQRELAERNRIAKEREALIAELKNKNTELERFTYTVSHNLKAPLITIQGFIGYLEKDTLSGNVGRVRDDIDRIVQATGKMQRLLNELLELSRIGRIINPPVKVIFNQLAYEAIELVHEQISTRGVKVSIDDNISAVYGDRARLLEVVQNLVDNAVKFMGDQSEPHIEIGQRGNENESRSILYIKDNGIGIDPQYHDKIFELFTKFDAHSDGTGIGLALVKRIIEMHGGRIWIESETAIGTTFFFTLPTFPG